MAWNIPVHSLVSLHNKDIICHFSSLLVNSGHFQLSSTLSITALLMELMAIKHGHHSFMLILETLRGCFFLFLAAMHTTLFKASNITGIEILLISYHFQCWGMFRAFTKNENVGHVCISLWINVLVKLFWWCNNSFWSLGWPPMYTFF